MLCVATVTVVNVHHYTDDHVSDKIRKIVSSKHLRKLHLTPKIEQLKTRKASRAPKASLCKQDTLKSGVEFDDKSDEDSNYFQSGMKLDAQRVWGLFATTLDRFFSLVHFIATAVVLGYFYFRY
ncbi:uncharacterized protein LOC142356959 [Convolutriloba macropyga]